MQFDLFEPAPEAPAIPTAAAVLAAVEAACVRLLAFRAADTLCEFQGRWYRLLEVADEILAPVAAEKERREEMRHRASAMERRTLSRFINEAVRLECDIQAHVESRYLAEYTQFTTALFARLSEDAQGELHEILSTDRACEQLGERTIASLVAHAAAQDAADAAADTEPEESEAGSLVAESFPPSLTPLPAAA